MVYISHGLANKSVLHRKIPTNFLLSFFLLGYFFCLNRWLLILIFNIISKNRTGRSLRKLHFGRRIQVFPSSGNSLNAPAVLGAFDFDVPRRLLVLSAGSWTKGACCFWSGSYRILTNSKLERGHKLTTMIIELDKILVILFYIGDMERIREINLCSCSRHI